MRGVSLYFHIPFCKQACPYCDFYFTTRQGLQEFFFKALLQEITLRKNYFSSLKIISLYFGGGTPSLSKTTDLEAVLLQVQKINPSLNENVEITLEMNFEDISYEKIKLYKKIGINRFSIGVQSIRKASLSYLNRYVNYADLFNVVKQFEKLKVVNYSFDLIYGFPALSNSHWINDLKKIVKLNPPHLSLYGLTVEKKTRLNHLIKKKILLPLDEDLTRNHFISARRILAHNDYEHYEISNWAKKKCYSKHNLNYWNGSAYLGFGPSAHSYYEKKRFFNPPQLKKYLNDLLIKKELIQETEVSSLANEINEYILLSIRTMWGISIKDFQTKFGECEKKKLLEKAVFFIQNKQLKLENHYLKATDQGKLLLDKITVELLV